ncbi:MAG: DoxX family protein [Acidobacteriota bacterium]
MNFKKMSGDRVRGSGRTVNVLLWIVQVLLALVFLFAGGMKLILPLEALAGPVALPGAFMRFLGVAEVLGAIGLILPGLLRIRPGLTPLAAVGLVIIMTGATGITMIWMDVAQAMVPLTVGLLAVAVAYSRVRVAPIAARSRQPRPVDVLPAEPAVSTAEA